MEISRESSQKISALSFFFAVAVVVAHCAWRQESSLESMISLLGARTCSRMAVQFFFVVSGFFLARHFDEDGWWRRESLKRARSLVVPYVFWTIVLAATLWLETREVMGIGGFGFNLCKIPALAPLWYVRCLLLFILTLPVLRILLDHGKAVTLVATYALAFGLVLAADFCGWSDESGLGGFFAYGYSFDGLFYFLSGIFLQRYWQPSVSRKTSLCLLCAGLALIGLKPVLHFKGSFGGVSFNLMVLNFLIAPLFLVGLWGLMRPWKLPQVLVGVAFPIYIMHGVVLSVLRNLGGVYRPCNPWLELTLGVAVPIVIYRLLRRFSHHLSDVLFGGR